MWGDGSTASSDGLRVTDRDNSPHAVLNRRYFEQQRGVSIITHVAAIYCRACRPIVQLAEIWEPKRSYTWMRRWLSSHRRRKAARETLARALAQRPRQYYQLKLGFL